MTSVNNCPILVKTLKDLHVQNFNTEKEDLSNIKNHVKNDLLICVHYYEHKMNNFRKLHKSKIIYSVK